MSGPLQPAPPPLSDIPRASPAGDAVQSWRQHSVNIAFRSTIQSPQESTPRRRSPSIRRTSHIDIVRVEDGSVVLTGTARDLATSSGVARVVSTASVRALVDAEGLLAELTTKPALGSASRLSRLPVGSGFRAAVDAAAPDERAAATPLYLLLDELPVATLIAGYELLYRGVITADSPAGTLPAIDVCSGWRSDGLMATTIREQGRALMPVGPPAPTLETVDDPIGWHRMDPLQRRMMRRRRLVEVGGTTSLRVVAMFRDSYVGDDGVEVVVHEYSLSASIDEAAGTLECVVATPHVLPLNECPEAAASASRLNGRSLATLRDTVRNELNGVGTCTHLNDLLRSLGDLSALIPMIDRTDGREGVQQRL